MDLAAVQAAAVFMARVAIQIPTFRALKVTKVVIISNLAKKVSSNNNPGIRVIQSSSMVDSIMCLPPVCVREIRSFIRGL